MAWDVKRACVRIVPAAMSRFVVATGLVPVASLRWALPP